MHICLGSIEVGLLGLYNESSLSTLVQGKSCGVGYRTSDRRINNRSLNAQTPERLRKGRRLVSGSIVAIRYRPKYQEIATLCQATVEPEGGPAWTTALFKGLLFRFHVSCGWCNLQLRFWETPRFWGCPGS